MGILAGRNGGRDYAEFYGETPLCMAIGLLAEQAYYGVRQAV